MAKRAGSRLGNGELKPGPTPSPTRASAPPAHPHHSHDALQMFQRGMESLQRHAYVDAARAFQGVVMGFPADSALTERARVYLGLCERELQRKPAAPRTVEERMTAATAALNNGDDGEAEEMARSVLGDNPKHDLALYLLAAIHARRGARDEALSLLGKVLILAPEASAQARADPDFAPLKDLDAFRKLTEPPILHGGTRRRRARAER